jgi:hypothetical protein
MASLTANASPPKAESPPKGDDKDKPKPADAPKPKKFLNGWTPELDDLMAEWADKAACYRWMHERTEKIFSRNDRFITIPVIILSTLTGTANFGLNSIFGDNANAAHLATLAIGGVSIIAGIITTLGNFLRYAQGSEAHRVSSISWGKFNRLITVELRINPNERMDSMSFLKICRIELDRLIEQSPPIPDSVIAAFRNEFGSSIDVKKPDIAAAIEHTKAFKDNGARLKKMAAEAAIMIQQKKGVLRQLVVSDIDVRIKEENDRMRLELKPMLEEIAKKAAQDTLRSMNLGGRGGTRESSPEPGPRGPTMSSSIHAKKAAEIKNELTKMASSGVVSMLKSQFKIGAELPISFTAPPLSITEKKDAEDEAEVEVEVEDKKDEKTLPDSITIDISGAPAVVTGEEPKTILHM